MFSFLLVLLIIVIELFYTAIYSILLEYNI